MTEKFYTEVHFCNILKFMQEELIYWQCFYFRRKTFSNKRQLLHSSYQCSKLCANDCPLFQNTIDMLLIACYSPLVIEKVNSDCRLLHKSKYHSKFAWLLGGATATAVNSVALRCRLCGASVAFDNWQKMSYGGSSVGINQLRFHF